MRTLATYRLFGTDGRSAAHVTKRLGLQATVAHGVGDALGARPRAHRAAVASWHLQSASKPEEGVELAQALTRVLDQLEPVGAVLHQLVEQGYSASWFCYVGSHALEHAVELDRRTLRRLVELPGDLLLDLYDEDD